MTEMAAPAVPTAVSSQQMAPARLTAPRLTLVAASASWLAIVNS